MLKKRIHVCIEHAHQYRCTKNFMQKVKNNDQLKVEVNTKSELVSTKRQPKGPKPGFILEGATLEIVISSAYDV